MATLRNTSFYRPRIRIVLLLSIFLLGAIFTVLTSFYNQPDAAAETIIFVYEDKGINGIYGINPDSKRRIPLSLANPTTLWVGDLYRQAPYRVRRFTSLNIDRMVPHNPTWSENGRLLAYKNHLYRQACDEIIYMDVMHQEPKTIACLNRDNYGEAFDWAPDGQRVAFALRENDAATIRVIDVQGQQTHRFSPGEIVWGLSWSPDSKRIAAAVANGLWLQIYHLDNSVVSLQAEAPPFGKPTWSPDGKSIAFFCYSEKSIDICMLHADGSKSQRFSFSPQFPYHKQHLQWSPNGQMMVFEAQQRGGQHDIFLINTDGSHVRQLTFHPASDLEPAWSPDGNHIVFVSLRDGNKELYTVNVDGTHLTRLTNTPGNETNPTWKPHASLP